MPYTVLIFPLDTLHIQLLFFPGHPVYTILISQSHPAYIVVIFPSHPVYAVVIFTWTPCIYSCYFCLDTLYAYRAVIDNLDYARWIQDYTVLYYNNNNIGGYFSQMLSKLMLSWVIQARMVLHVTL